MKIIKGKTKGEKKKKQITQTRTVTHYVTDPSTRQGERPTTDNNKKYSFMKLKHGRESQTGARSHD
jgi:hypothetical protein